MEVIFALFANKISPHSLLIWKFQSKFKTSWRLNLCVFFELQQKVNAQLSRSYLFVQPWKEQRAVFSPNVQRNCNEIVHYLLIFFVTFDIFDSGRKRYKEQVSIYIFCKVDTLKSAASRLPLTHSKWKISKFQVKFKKNEFIFMI